MVVITAVVVLLALVWFLTRDGRAALRSRGWLGEPADQEPAPAVVESDFGRWPGVCDTAGEGREAALTRQLLAGTIEPSLYRRLMAELARTNSQPSTRW